MAALWGGEPGVVLVTCLGAYFLSMAMIYQTRGADVDFYLEQDLGTFFERNNGVV